MPGLVLGALYLISSLPTTSRGRYDDAVSLLSLREVNSQKPDSNQAWQTCSKLHCLPVRKPGCLYSGSRCLPSAWPGSSYRPPFDLPGILRPHALPMASFTQACPSLVVSFHLPLSAQTPWTMGLPHCAEQEMGLRDSEGDKPASVLHLGCL